MKYTFVGYSDDRRGPAYWAILALFAALGSLSWVVDARAQPASVAPLAPQATPAPPAAPPQPAPAPPGEATPPAAPPLPLSADHQAGFCVGWNSAAQVEQQRYGNWRALATLGQPAPDSPASVAVNSVPLYVLIQPLPPGSTLSLGDGRTVTCPAEVKK